MASRFQIARNMTEGASGSQLQRNSSFYCSRGKVYKGYGWEGLIGHKTAPNYHMGRRKARLKQVLSHVAFAGSSVQGDPPNKVRHLSSETLSN